MKKQNDEKQEQAQKVTPKAIDVLTLLAQEQFIMDGTAKPSGKQPELLTSYDIREMFKDFVEVGIGEVSLLMLRLAFKPKYIDGKPFWAVYRR